MPSEARPSNTTPVPAASGAQASGRTRVLLIHQNFPGQFRHVALALQARPDVQLITLGRQSAPGLAGVQTLRYQPHRTASAHTHPYCTSFETAVLHGQAVFKRLVQLQQTGFTPDVVLAHPGWGETLYLKHVFPHCRLIHLCEWYYRADSPDMGFDPEFPTSTDERLRALTRQAHHLMALDLCDLAVAPTHWQKSQFPHRYQSKIEVLHEGVPCEQLGPDPQARFKLPNGHELKAGDPVVTYVARNLEPYRGFHRLVRSLPAILATHPDCQVLVIGGDKTSYGRPPTNAANWREALLGAAAQQHPAQPALDTSRVHFLGVLPTDSYRKALQISAAHLYLTYPFVLSWSLIEAMASACLLIASDTAPVRELIEHQRNGLLVDFFSEEQLVQAVSSALHQPAQFQTLRQTAMADARQGYSREAGTRAYVRWILGDKPSHPRNGPDLAATDPHTHGMHPGQAGG